MPQTKLQTFTVTYLDKQEFHSIKDEIFNSDVYYFETDNPTPLIIDAGAHIGMATLYFKKLFPFAQIIAIEPNPIAFKILEENIWQNNLSDIQTLNIVLDANNSEITLHQDPDQEWLSSTSIREGAWNGEQKTEPITVPARKLSEFLDQPIDLLKLDIEGAEISVLQEASDKLKNIQRMIIECHATKFETLSNLQSHLEKMGFTVSYYKRNKEITIQQARGLFFLQAKQ